MNRSFKGGSQDGAMRKLSTLLRSRLAEHGTISGGHPDSDLLLAFSEHSLRGAERAAVVKHLATCAECREVVARSLPVDSPKPHSKPRSAWIAGAAMAFVCLAIAVLVLPILRTRPPAKPALPDVATNIQQQLPVAVPASAQPGAPPAPKALPRKHLTAPKPLSLIPPPVKGDALGKPDQPHPDQLPALLQHAEAEMEAAPPPPAPQPRLEIQRKNAMTPTAGFVLTAPAVTMQAFAPTLRAAKPVVWTLEPASIRGAVRRSGDGGRTWETVSVDNATKFYALSASGSDIWVGGANGGLFHSIDGGGHWLPVAVADENARLSGPIVKIDQRNAGVLTLKTSTGTLWTSQDRGLHWRRDPE